MQFTKTPDAETLAILEAVKASRETIWNAYELSQQKASDWVTLAVKLDMTIRGLLIAFGVPFRNTPDNQADHNQDNEVPRQYDAIFAANIIEILSK